MLGFRDKNRAVPDSDPGVGGSDGLGPLPRSADAPLPALYTRRPPITWGRRARARETAERAARGGEPADRHPRAKIRG